MIKIVLERFSILVLFFLSACGHAERATANPAKNAEEKLIAVSQQNAYSAILLDSAGVEAFIKDHALSDQRARQVRQFYKSRDYQFAWFDEEGVSQQASAFWNLHNRYLNTIRDSSFFDKTLHRQMKALLNNDDVDRNEYDVTQLELELTDHFFDYAQYAYSGRVDPEKLQWYIPRKKINAIALLDSLIQRNGQQVDEWEPVNEQYQMVRKALVRLYDIQKKGGWPVIDVSQIKAYRQGDSALAIGQLKQRLFLVGDFRSQDQSPVFTPELAAAVEQAQRRFGLAPDGVVGPRTLRELNKPVEKRIEQLLVNMERMRWMPAYREGLRLVANIPEFKLHVYDGSNELFQMPIVVGKTANQTVVFSDELKYIVFSPYWNVPASIVRKEILPAMQRDPGYLASHDMEQTGTRGGLPVIRQKPGGSNALGRVKFLFPNSYSIYFHDTPAKSLFQQQRRAFSHGCIRLAEPKRLAAFLLKDHASWTEERINNAMYAGKETWVTLERPVPVEITYFTAFVDGEGLLNFRDDIYGHDEELADRLFQH